MSVARHLVIFVKAPVAGRVKTRLAAEIGAAPAARIYRRMTADIIARLKAGPWRTWLAVAPPGAVSDSRFWPADLPRIAQGSGDLGARLMRVTRVLPPGPVAIVGSDCPAMTERDIADAFKGLARVPVVLGPAMDGGYWLIAAKRPLHPHVFHGVRWSSAYAMADTIGNLHRPPALLRTLRDIDTAADLRVWHERRAPKNR